MATATKVKTHYDLYIVRGSTAATLMYYMNYNIVNVNASTLLSCSHGVFVLTVLIDTS